MYQDELTLEKKSIVYEQRPFNKDKEFKLKEKLAIRESKLNNLKAEIKTLYDSQDRLIKEIDALKCNIDFLNNFNSYTRLDGKLSELVKKVNTYDLMKRAEIAQSMSERYNQIKESKGKDDKALIDCQQRYQINLNAIKDTETKVKKARFEYKEIKKLLIVHYHSLLLEGRDTREEGLSWIIKEIWNLNSTIIISNFPAFLDEEAITFLFNYTAQYFQLIKLQKQVSLSKTSSSTEPLFTQENSVKHIKNISPKNPLLSRVSRNSTERIEEQRFLTMIPSQSQTKQISPKAFGHLIFVKAMENKIECIKNGMSQSKRNEIKRLKREFEEFDYEKKYNASFGIVISAIAGEETALEEITKIIKFKNINNPVESSMDNFKRIYKIRFPKINLFQSRKLKKPIDEEEEVEEEKDKDREESPNKVE